MGKIDDIHNTILNNIDNSYQKTQGFPTYDLTRGFAFSIKETDDKVVEVANKQIIANLTGKELDTIVHDRTGIIRKSSVKSVGSIRIVDGDGSILIGDLFSTESGILFRSLESKSVTNDDTVLIEAVDGGSSGNVPSGAITELPVTIRGINEITNDEPTEGGYDIETDEALLARYYKVLQTPVNGNNVNQYILWAEDCAGVGKARCIPVWNGKNTVKVVLVGSDFRPASSNIVTLVQNTLDPNNNGDGSGLASIGAVVTVVSATTKDIDVTIKGLEIENGYSVDLVKEDIKTNIDRYIRTSAFNTDYVSIAKIGGVIIDTNGTKDFAEVLLNGSHQSIQLDSDECGVLNDVEYTA